MKILILATLVASYTLEAQAVTDSLSYSGRLVQSNGAPVSGPVNLVLDLAYTSAPSTILCTQTLTSVPLSQGVFHVQYVPNCGASTLAQILQNAPTNETIAIRVTDSTNSKVYAYQAVHALPYAQVAKQVDKLGASSGQVLAWDGTKWAPTTITTNSGTYTDGSVIQADTGTAAAPSLSFQVSPSSGFYASGSNNIGVAVNGTQVFNFDSTGLSSPIAGGADIGTAAGSATAPTYSFAGDSNTGWFSPLTDALAAATGGVERIRINSNGNIGVGTTSSTYRLDVQTNSSSNVMRTVSDGNKSQIDSYSYNDTATDEAQLNLLRSRGTVAAPVVVAQDDELGAVQFGGYNDAASSFSLGASVSGAADEEWATSGDTTDAPTRLDFSTTPNGSSTRQVRMRIKENGSIGVGVLSPSALMHLAAGSMAPGSAPLKLTAGSNLIVPESGAIEYDGTNLYFTDNTGTRKALAASSGSGSLAVGSGSASSPSLSFSSDTDTGFYDSAANTIGIAAGGSQIFSMGSTGLVSATNGGGSVSTAAGSAAAPTFAFTGDEDTGWYAPLANTLAAATGGVERVRIDSSGNVGIGTTSANEKLQIYQGNVRVSNQYKFRTEHSGGGVSTDIYTDSSNNFNIKETANLGDIRIGANSLDTLTVTKAGNVGVGTTNPASLFQVGSSAVSNASFTGNTATFNSNNASTPAVTINNNNTGATLRLQTSGVTTFLADNNGNIGVGTTAPTASLHLKAGTAAANTAPFKLTAGTNLTTPEAGAVEFDGTNLYYTDSTNTRKTLATGAVSAYGSGSTINAADGTAGAPSLSFANDTDTGLYDAGSNTIGVSAGGSQIFSMSSTGLVSATNGGGSVSTAAGDATAPTFSFAGDTDTGWYAPLANTLAAATGGVERVRIDSTGKIGIGTTSPSEKLMVSGGNVRVDNDYKYMFAGGGSFIQGNSGSDYILLQTGSGGLLKFNTAGANERMRIDASGNVGIGTTAPSSQLHVGGSARVDGNLVLSSRATFLAGPNASDLQINLNRHLLFIPTSTGKVGIGVTDPTGRLHLPAGTATANSAPLKLTAGTNLTTPEAGAVEFDGTYLYYTDSTNTRKTLATGGSAYSSGSTINAADGTAAAPSLSFANDTDTGLYDAGSNTIGVSAGGSQIFSMSSTGLVSSTAGGGSVSTAAGSAAAPTFSFAGDTDTGWYAPLANTLAAATGGAERVRIDSSGNVGFGTTVPSRPVHIADSAAATLLLENTSSTADARRKYITSTADSFAIGKITDDMSTATEHLRIDNSGNIGIGTTSPSTKIHVSGASTKLRLTRTTNNINDDQMLIFNTDTSSNRNVAIFFNDSTNTNYGSINGFLGHSGSTSNTSIRNGTNGFYVMGNTGLATYQNRFGFGTGTPSSTLSIAGQSAVTLGVERNTTANTAGNSMTVLSGGAATGATDKSGGTLFLQSGIATGTGSSDIHFQTATAQGSSNTTDNNPTTKMVVLGNGNVGVGTSTPTAILQLKAGTAAANTAPLKLTAGTNLTTPEAGAIEFDGTNLYVTDSTNSRKTIATTSSTFGSGSTITAADGSAAAPSLSFANDSDTGFYDSGTNSIGVAAGGAQIFDISSSGLVSSTAGGGLVSTAAGTAAAPTFSFAGDTDTGWYSPAANTLAAATGAAERVRINSSGNVGIGTTNPTYPLHVVRASTTDGQIALQSNSSTAAVGVDFIGSSGVRAGLIGTRGTGASAPNSTFGYFVWSDSFGNPMIFGTANAERMRIDGSGLVGIGTTSPAATLHLAGNRSTLVGGSGAGAGLQIASATYTDTTSSGSVPNPTAAHGIAAPTFAASSATTYSRPITFYIGGAPTAGTNATFGNSHALYVQSGMSTFKGGIGVGTDGGSPTLQRDSLVNIGGNVSGTWTSGVGAYLSVGNSSPTLTQTSVSGTINYSTSASFAAPTFAFTNATTSTVASTVLIGGAPSAGTNATITNAHALHVISGNTYLGGNLGVGVLNPTALLHLKAGTATANTAPLKFASGTNLTTPEAGAVEYDGTNLYFTDSTATRKTIATTSGGSMSNISSISNSSGNISISPNSMSGTVTVGPGATSTSSSTGTLVVSGDQGVTGSINVGTSVLTGSGSAAAPSMSFGGDTDTGWFAPLANTLAAATGGAERIRIDSSGKVGIGTTSPTQALEVNGVIKATGATGYPGFQTVGVANAPNIVSFRSGTGGSLTSPTYPADGDLLLYLTGRNAVDTGSPAGFMQMAAVGAHSATARGANISFATTPSGTTTTTTRVTITDNGYVGIGTTTPATALEVYSNSADTGLRLTRNGTTYTQFTTPMGGATAVKVTYNGTTPIATFAANGGMTVGSTYSDASVVPPSSGFLVQGNVGIGTTSPSAKLHVSGGAIVGAAAVSVAASTVDFSTGNMQYTANDCGAFTLNNMKDGGSYAFVVQGSNPTTCAFTAYTGVATGALTVHLPPNFGNTTVNTHTLFNFIVMGTHVYVSWTPGY